MEIHTFRFNISIDVYCDLAWKSLTILMIGRMSNLQICKKLMLVMFLKISLIETAHRYSSLAN